MTTSTDRCARAQIDRSIHFTPARSMGGGGMSLTTPSQLQRDCSCTIRQTSSCAASMASTASPGRTSVAARPCQLAFNTDCALRASTPSRASNNTVSSSGAGCRVKVAVCRCQPHAAACSTHADNSAASSLAPASTSIDAERSSAASRCAGIPAHTMTISAGHSSGEASVESSTSQPADNSTGFSDASSAPTRRTRPGPAARRQCSARSAANIGANTIAGSSLGRDALMVVITPRHRWPVRASC